MAVAGIDVAQFVLAGFFFLTFLGGVVAIVGPYHPKTLTLKRFGAFLIVNSVCRFFYFAIPSWIWANGEVPTDYVKYSREWWTNFAQFFLYVTANTMILGNYTAILTMWYQAWVIVRRESHPWIERSLWGVVAFYGGWQVICIITYVSAAPFFTVLTMTGIVTTLTSVFVFVAFLYFWCKLRKELEPLEAAAKTSQKLLTPEDVMLNNSSAEMFQSARKKLERIRMVCIFCTISAAGKAGMQLYQLYDVLLGGAVGGFPQEDVWILIIIMYYSITEIFVNCGVLVFMRKGKTNSQTAAVGGGSSGASGSLPSSSMAGMGMTAYGGGAYGGGYSNASYPGSIMGGGGGYSSGPGKYAELPRGDAAYMA